uniref:Uncharacterized protein n=1 Tax=Opuntia streptacantha TaxID=393608 RepID=A0A7C9F6G0_OPUST
MGNHCCRCSCFEHSNAAMLVDSEGGLTPVPLPASVAELMIDHPGFALCLADDIRQSHRLVSMKIHQTLAPRTVYLLIPMEKVDARVSDPEIVAIGFLCSPKRAKRIAAAICLRGLLASRGSRRKEGWAPALEPIPEES